MDQNDLRAAITVLTLIVFIGIVIWAYSARQKHRFDEAAKLPFADDDDDAAQRLTGEQRNG